MTDPRPLVKPAASAASSSPSPEAIGPEAYARWRATTLGAVTEALERRLLHQLIGVVKGKRVLDLGCGDGRLTAALEERGARAVGVDIDRAMLRAAVARTVDAVRGSVYYPPVGLLAGALAPLDQWLGSVTTVGAALLDADEAPNVLVLDAEPFQTRGLRPAEDGPVYVDRRGLSLVADAVRVCSHTREYSTAAR